MNEVTKVVFEKRKHILEVDGVQYAVPQRTAALEKLIRERDAKINEMTEYEANMKMLEILFGEEAAHKMFNEGEQTNLDKLEKCVKYSIALYMADHVDMTAKNIRSEMLGTYKPGGKKKK